MARKLRRRKEESARGLQCVRYGVRYRRAIGAWLEEEACGKRNALAARMCDTAGVPLAQAKLHEAWHGRRRTGLPATGRGGVVAARRWRNGTAD